MRNIILSELHQSLVKELEACLSRHLMLYFAREESKKAIHHSKSALKATMKLEP